MGWGSFLLGMGFGGILFGFIGLIFGFLSAAYFQDSRMNPTESLVQCGNRLQRGEMITMTLGRETVFCPHQDDDDDDDEQETPLGPQVGWGRG